MGQSTSSASDKGKQEEDALRENRLRLLNAMRPVPSAGRGVGAVAPRQRALERFINEALRIGLIAGAEGVRFFSAGVVDTVGYTPRLRMFMPSDGVFATDAFQMFVAPGGMFTYDQRLWPLVAVTVTEGLPFEATILYLQNLSRGQGLEIDFETVAPAIAVTFRCLHAARMAIDARPRTVGPVEYEGMGVQAYVDVRLEVDTPEVVSIDELGWTRALMRRVVQSMDNFRTKAFRDVQPYTKILLAGLSPEALFRFLVKSTPILVRYAFSTVGYSQAMMREVELRTLQCVLFCDNWNTELRQQAEVQERIDAMSEVFTLLERRLTSMRSMCTDLMSIQTRLSGYLREGRVFRMRRTEEGTFIDPRQLSIQEIETDLFLLAKRSRNLSGSFMEILTNQYMPIASLLDNYREAAKDLLSYLGFPPDHPVYTLFNRMRNDSLNGGVNPIEKKIQSDLRVSNTMTTNFSTFSGVSTTFHAGHVADFEEALANADKIDPREFGIDPDAPPVGPPMCKTFGCFGRKATLHCGECMAGYCSEACAKIDLERGLHSAAECKRAAAVGTYMPAGTQ